MNSLREHIQEKIQERSSRPITLLYLFDELGGKDYQTKIFTGLVSTAEEYGIKLISVKMCDHSGEYRNYLQDVDLSLIDGVLILGSVGTHMHPEEFVKLHASFSPKPTVSIGTPVEGVTSVMVDNYTGVYQAVQHLIKEHNARNIAFIRGPVDVPEANERYQAYKDAVNDSEFPVTKSGDLVYCGGFDSFYGSDAVTHFLKLGIKMDAIVAVNDNTAIGAIEQLRIHGYKVPSDVAVVGFDDSDEAQYFIPGITTVLQPLLRLGETSVTALLSKILGISFPPVKYINTDLILRQSCGCRGSVMDTEDSPIEFKDSNVPEKDDLEAFLASLRVKTYTYSMNSSYLVEKISVSIYKKFFETIITDKKEEFFLLLEDSFNEIFLSKVDTGFWTFLLKLISSRIYFYEDKQKLRDKFNDLLCRFKSFISEANSRRELYKNVLLKKSFVKTTDMSYSLTMHYDFQDIKKELEKQSPSLGISNLYISLFEDYGKESPDKGPSQEMSKFFLALSEGKPLDLGVNKPFKTSELLGFFEERSLVIMPLVVSGDFMGYIAFKAEPSHSFSFTMLQRYIANAIYGAIVVRERLYAEQRLKSTLEELETINNSLKNMSIKDELTGLYNRRGFFQMAQSYYDLSKRNKKSFLLLFIDLDGLKKINDQHGHEAGDYIIKGAALVLKESFRYTDIVSRIGGDEFVAIAIDSDSSSIDKIKDHIQINVDKFNRDILKPFKLGLSVGFVEGSPTSQDPLETLISKADVELYKSKLVKKSELK